MRCAVREIPLSDFGLETVAQACARMKWPSKSVSNWIHNGLLSVVGPVGPGRGTLLLLTKEVDAFVRPPRGRPKPVPLAPAPKPTAAKKPRAKKGD